MAEQSRRPKQVLGPLGSVLTVDDLPPPNVKRWIAHRKAKIVCAVRVGLITLEEVVDRYGITQEEFLSWERLLDEHGLPGLRMTRRLKYRKQARTPESVVSREPHRDPEASQESCQCPVMSLASVRTVPLDRRRPLSRS